MKTLITAAVALAMAAAPAFAQSTAGSPSGAGDNSGRGSSHGESSGPAVGASNSGAAMQPPSQGQTSARPYSGEHVNPGKRATSDTYGTGGSTSGSSSTGHDANEPR